MSAILAVMVSFFAKIRSYCCNLMTRLFLSSMSSRPLLIKGVKKTKTLMINTTINKPKASQRSCSSGLNKSHSLSLFTVATVCFYHIYRNLKALKFANSILSNRRNKTCISKHIGVFQNSN